MTSCTLLLLLASCSGALASHFYGGTMTFTPKGRNPDGSFRVDIRYKETFHVCYHWNSWNCHSGNCGNITQFEIDEVDHSSSGRSWCQSEALMTRNIPSNKPFELRKTGCCWIFNVQSNWEPWRLLTLVDLGIRSDTGEPNRSPVTTILPFIRVPQNCNRRFNLLAHDPDRDRVKCRYGFAHANECVYCNQHSGFLLDQNSCTLTYMYNNFQGARAFEIVLEDYPRQHITLSYTDGTLSSKSPLVAMKRKRSPTATTATWLWWNQPSTTPAPYWGSQLHSTPSPWWWNQPINTPAPYWGSQLHSTPSPWWWNQPITTPAPYWGSQLHSTPSPWWWNQPITTPAPYWGSQLHSTPSPWWWNQPINTPAPYGGSQLHSTPSPWWWNQPITTPAPYWGSQLHSTPSPWWWNQPITTPAPYWGSQLHSTPSPWWWNQPITTPAPQWWNQPSTTPAPQSGQQSSATPFSWWMWNTSPPKNQFQSTTALTSVPNYYPWWAWPKTSATSTPTPPSATLQWQQPTTTTSVPTTPYHGPSTGPLSKIPLQFAIQVDPPVSSCTEGQILPQFLSPTPANGDILNASINQELEIMLKATATQSWVNNFIVSGPLNITKYNTINVAVGESLIRWTPTENDFGEHVPICFIAESQSGSRIYHSEMRCIIVIVGHTYGKANVVCTETTMTVEVEKSSIIGLHEDHLRLNDPTCTPISNGTHVIAAMSLSSCGTQLEEDADNLIFKNEIMSYDKFSDVITRKHQVEIGFSCMYPKKGRVSLEFRAHKLPFVFTEKGFGKFTYQFEFFHSRQFNSMMNPNSYPIEVALKEMLYMDIKASSSIANTVVFVESCRATPVDDPNYHIFYDIFENGCTVDETVVVYPSNHTEYKFGIEAFKFIGQHEEVFISCSVILCVAGTPGSRCSQGCINATASPLAHHHHRRAAVTETVRHHISQGPLRLKKTTDITVSNMGLNMDLVFIAGILLVVVVIVSGAVIYTTKRPKVKYQPLPSADF